MNKVILIGNLTKDPERRDTMDGTPRTFLSIAVNGTRLDRKADGEYKREKTPYYWRATCWRQHAITAEKYLKKGRKVWVMGPVEINFAKDEKGNVIYRNGTNECLFNLDIKVDELEFVGGYANSGQEGGTPAEGESAPGEGRTNEQAQTGAPAGFTPIETDELPF